MRILKDEASGCELLINNESDRKVTIQCNRQEYNMLMDIMDSGDTGNSKGLYESKESDKKYILTDQSIEYHGRTLYRIKRVNDGEIGGFVEGYGNLSHEGSCFISDDAKVYGGASVSGNAVLGNQAEVYGSAHVSGYAAVLGNASISGEAGIMEDAYIHKDAVITGSTQVNGRVEICGDTFVNGVCLIEDGVFIDGNIDIPGDTHISGNSIIRGDGTVKGSVIHDAEIIVQSADIEFNILENQKVVVSGNCTSEK